MIFPIKCCFREPCVCWHIPIQSNSFAFPWIPSPQGSLAFGQPQACTGPRFNIKMTSYWYRKSHCGDKTILRPSYLHNGISYTGKTTSLYWIGALVFEKYHMTTTKPFLDPWPWLGHPDTHNGDWQRLTIFSAKLVLSWWRRSMWQTHQVWL